jgi:hypothetical protein
MVFDEDTEEYRPRFGYTRAEGGLKHMPIVEVKEGEDEFADPWAADRKQKKDRVKQNEKNHMRNLNRAGKISVEKKGFGRKYVIFVLFSSTRSYMTEFFVFW